MKKQLIYLIGSRGSGKTSVGKGLASRLHYHFADTDALLCTMQNRSVAQIVAADGWDVFRIYETASLVAASAIKKTVVATGGGAIVRDANCSFMKKHGTTFFIDVPAQELARRLSTDPNEAQRPSLTGNGLVEEIRDILAERMELYTHCADYTINGSQEIEEIIDNIVELLDNSLDS